MILFGRRNSKLVRRRHQIGTQAEQLQRGQFGQPVDPLPVEFIERLIETLRQRPDLCQVFSDVVRRGIAKLKRGGADAN